MDVGIVLGIVLAFALGTVGFLVGFIWGAGTVVGRVRRFYDVVRADNMASAPAINAIGNVLAYLEGRITIE